MEKQDETRVNYYETGLGVMPVGLHPKGATTEGVQDMPGNVLEWVADWYYDRNKKRELRRGSFLLIGRDLRSARQIYYEPEYRYSNIGFRCVRDSP